MLVVRNLKKITGINGHKVIQKRNCDREMVVNKSAAVLTQVGGSSADGRALPQFNILPAKSIDPFITRNSCVSHFPRFNKYDQQTDFYGAHEATFNISNDNIFRSLRGDTSVSQFYQHIDTPQPAIWTCNDSGGMTDDMGITYINKVIIPAFNPTMKNPMVLLCDGHGSHISYEFLQACHGGGATPKIFLILRPPHTSHKLQVEDVVSFGVYKPLLAKSRALAFMKKMLHSQRSSGLNMLDLNDICKAPWETAFSRVNNLSGWRTSGVSPFTRRVMWDLHASEQQDTIDLQGHEDVNIDFTTKSMIDLVSPTSDEEESGDDDEDFGGARKRRLTSANLWALEGGCTSVEAMKLVRQNHEASIAKAIEKASRANKRINAKVMRDNELRAQSRTLLDKLEAKTLTLATLKVKELSSLCFFFDVVIPQGTKKGALLALVRTIDHPCCCV